VVARDGWWLVAGGWWLVAGGVMATTWLMVGCRFAATEAVAHLASFVDSPHDDLREHALLALANLADNGLSFLPSSRNHPLPRTCACALLAALL
jgi:hypothetical protein